MRRFRERSPLAVASHERNRRRTLVALHAGSDRHGSCLRTRHPRCDQRGRRAELHQVAHLASPTLEHYSTWTRVIARSTGGSITPTSTYQLEHLEHPNNEASTHHWRRRSTPSPTPTQPNRPPPHPPPQGGTPCPKSYTQSRTFGISKFPGLPYIRRSGPHCSRGDALSLLSSHMPLHHICSNV